MNKLLSIMMILIILLAGCSKAPLPTEVIEKTPETQPKMSVLKVKAITSTSSGVDSADVFLNGELIGKTPLEYETDARGTFAVRVQKQHFMIYGQSVVINPSDVIYVEALLKKLPSDKGQLFVTVNQDSCDIAVNDYSGNLMQQKQGKEMAAVLPAAGYFIKVSKKGYESIYRATNVWNDSVTIENLCLNPEKAQQQPELALSVPDSAQIHQPFTIEWQSNYAIRVDIDYVTEPGLNGRREISFSTSAKRYISASAYNEFGKVTVTDSIIIYQPEIIQPEAPVLEFAATPKVAEFGTPVKLEWFTDGECVIIDQGVGMRGKQGTEEVVFTSSGTKIITAIAYNARKMKTIVKDSVYIKQPEGPVLPTIELITDDTVEVNGPAIIEWHSQNATRIDIDYLGETGLNGKTEIRFETPGIRIITATAYNQIGQTTATDTLFVKEKPIQIEPIIVQSGAVVCADHYSIPKVVENAAEVNIQIAGFYRIVAEVDFNSGDEQVNESCFLSVKYKDKIEWPIDPNAGKYKVIVDVPGPPQILDMDAGTFFFNSGNNIIGLHHYKTIADEFPQFVNGEKISGANSVRTVSFRIEFVRN